MLPYNCIYCPNSFEKKGEHVFPFALGGENVYMDCVCPKCNNNFAAIEQELYQKSVIGLIRSVEGIEGYSPNKDNPAPFKAQILLTHDTTNNIVLEIGQNLGFETYVRPQTYFHQKKLYFEADSQKTNIDFKTTFWKWIDNNGLLTAYLGGTAVGFKYSLVNGSYQYSEVSEMVGMKKAIKFCTLPLDHKLFNNLSPRLYLDDDGQLHIRAITIAEATVFLKDLLNDTLKNSAYSGFPNLNLTSPKIEVGFGFNGLKAEQALIKIGINCLVHYYPGIKGHSSLAPHISFVKNGTPNISRAVDKKNDIKDNVANTHNIFFFQTGNMLNIRISLFNGRFAFAFWIDGIHVLKPNTYSRLLIDYRLRTNTFQDNAAFLGSFSSKKIRQTEH